MKGGRKEGKARKKREGTTLLLHVLVLVMSACALGHLLSWLRRSFCGARARVPVMYNGLQRAGGALRGGGSLWGVATR